MGKLYRVIPNLYHTKVPDNLQFGYETKELFRDALRRLLDRFACRTGECIDDTMFMYCDNGSYAIKECTSCQGNVCDNSFVTECTTNTCATNTMIKECGSDGKYQAPRSCGEGKICSIDSCIDDPNPGQKCTVDECNSDGMLLKCEGGYFAAPDLSCDNAVGVALFGALKENAV